MVSRISTSLSLLVLTGALIVGDVQADNWPQFRGASFDGIAKSECPTSWSSEQNVRWKIAVAGEGWSAPVIWDNRVFLTSAIRTDGGDAKPEPYTNQGGSNRTDLQNVKYRWDVFCLDTKTGKELWRKTAKTGNPPMPRHSTNTYATETPVTDGKHVYAYFGMTGLFCYDINGELVWQKDLGNYEMRAGWGTSSSPVLFEDKLFVQVDNEEQSFLVAINTKNGDELWRMQRDENSQYSSPIIWQNSERAELIVGGIFYRSYDPATGKLLWELDMEKGRSSATPVAVADRLYVGTEFRNRGGADDGGGYLFSIKPGGSGNISPPAGASSSQFVEWKIRDSGIQMASPVLCNDKIYLLERRRGAIHCISAKTGETVYRQRFPGARAFWSSPLTCDGKVLATAADGTTYVLGGDSKFEILSENKIPELTWSTPAIANGALFFRTVDHLYCIGRGGR